jgi:hypothetical protein
MAKIQTYGLRGETLNVECYVFKFPTVLVFIGCPGYVVYRMIAI